MKRAISAKSRPRTTSAWSAYERFIDSVVKELKPHYAIDEICGGERNRIAGISARHQVDVSFVDRDTSPPTLVLIECKSFKQTSSRAVTLGQVKVLRATIEDIAAHPRSNPGRVAGIFVSTRGAQRGAMSFARYHNIDFQRVSARAPWSFKYRDVHQIGPAGQKVKVRAGAVAPSIEVQLTSVLIRTAPPPST